MSKLNVVREGEEKKFFAASRDWEDDREEKIYKSDKRAWFVAGTAVVIAIACALALASLAPFKRVVPYVYVVDKATGNVELVSAADDRTVVGYKELTDKHWAQRYVIAREAYYWPLLQFDYDTVLALSSDNVGRDFAHLYEGPNARDKKYGPGIEMRIKVLSVTLAQDEVGTKAVVRFEKSVKRTEADRPDTPQYYVATMAFEYKPSMFGKEIYLIQNPLGFRVISYRVDAELAEPSAINASTILPIGGVAASTPPAPVANPNAFAPSKAAEPVPLVLPSKKQ
jgi:type IV secretion system protein VirB8